MARGDLRDLLTEPAWADDDTGMSIPDTRHACSVCLPTWESVIDYEEGRDKITRKMRCGYPRFFCHPSVVRLFAEAEKQLAENGQRVVVFPTRDAAQRAQRFVEKRSGSASRVVSYEGLQAVIVSAEDHPVAMEYWRYTGEIVSSRQAERVLRGADVGPMRSQSLRRRLAGHSDVSPEDMFIYENGMAAVFATHRMVSKFSAGKKSLQVEFPYVDSLKVQNNFGNGVVYLNEAVGESLEEALGRIRNGEFSAVYCEAPSNPLLRTVDIPAVSKACREGGVPLVVDDTICSVYNVDVSPYTDVITSSLTKWVSGKGDVMAGQITLCPDSPLYSDMREFFEADCPNGNRMYASDARVLARNISGFSRRVKASNVSGEAVADYLQAHPMVEQVWYPKFTTTDNYHAIQREGAGYGGLLSFCLKNKKKSAKFYDNLKLSKGPSLGTEFTLVCPYTMLAHYDELEWAEGCGVDRHLLRVSVGTEDLQRLFVAFDDAFAAI